jgi:hypothetical protein
MDLDQVNLDFSHENNIPLSELNVLHNSSYEIGKIILHDFYSEISTHHHHHMANTI